MTGELWTIIGLLLTNAGFLFGMWKYFDSRVSRVYARLDEVKQHAEENFVRKDNCMLMHTTTAENLKGVELRMNARFDKLEARFDKIVDLLTDKK